MLRHVKANESRIFGLPEKAVTSFDSKQQCVSLFNVLSILTLVGVMWRRHWQMGRQDRKMFSVTGDSTMPSRRCLTVAPIMGQQTQTANRLCTLPGKQVNTVVIEVQYSGRNVQSKRGILVAFHYEGKCTSHTPHSRADQCKDGSRECINLDARRCTGDSIGWG